MYSSRRKRIGVFVAIAAIMIICLTCAGAAAQDEDWLGPGGAAPTYTGDIYHMGKVGIDTEEPNAKLHVADHLTDANHPSILIEKASTTSLSPRLGMVDTNYDQAGPYDVEDCPMWSIDNFRDQFRIYRQPDKSTMGPENQSLLINNEFEVGIGTSTPTERLDVNGKVRVRDLPEGNNLTDIVVADADGVLHIRDASTLDGGGGGADTDWLGPGGAAPTNTGDIYHASGKVGIGTTTPDSELDMAGGTISNLDGVRGGPGTSQPLRLYAAGPIDFLSGYSTGDAFYWYISVVDNAHLKMIMNKDGKLGIGTTSPTAKLDVHGSANEVTSLLESDGHAISQIKAGGVANAYLELYSAQCPPGKEWKIYTDFTNRDLIFWHDGLNLLTLTTTTPKPTLTWAGDIKKTGTNGFVQDYPNDPSKEIVYASLEGPEAGTYIRGSAELVNGEAVVNLPEDFNLVTSDEGLTVQLTPVGEWLQLYVVEKSTQRIIVREVNGKNGQFDYLVQGVRKGYENYQVIRDKE